MDRDELIGEIRRILKLNTAPYKSAFEAWDAYEAYIFSLIVATASRHGASVAYEDVHGAKVSDLVFRTSPGSLYGTSQPFTHAIIEFAGAPELEVHIGVLVQGASGVLHECDVLVLPAEEAELSRAQRINPRGNQGILIVECKYYTSKMRIGLARNFEGMRADVHAKGEIMVTNDVASSSIVRYLDARKRAFERKVVPRADQVGYFQAEVRKAFKSYLSKHAPSTMI